MWAITMSTRFLPVRRLLESLATLITEAGCPCAAISQAFAALSARKMSRLTCTDRISRPRTPHSRRFAPRSWHSARNDCWISRKRMCRLIFIQPHLACSVSTPLENCRGVSLESKKLLSLERFLLWAPLNAWTISSLVCYAQGNQMYPTNLRPASDVIYTDFDGKEGILV